MSFVTAKLGPAHSPAGRGGRGREGTQEGIH